MNTDMITNTIKKLILNERGFALPAALGLLVLGGLLIVPSINLVTTSLNGVRRIENEVKANYAAEAGIEYGLWCAKNGITPTAQLAENINGLTVSVQSTSEGSFTLYLGQFIETRVHFEYITVTSDIWDESAQAYRHVITVTWAPESGSPPIWLDQIGARFAPGYSYQIGSAALFADNVSMAEPELMVDAQGANMVNWTFSNPYPQVSQSNPVATQTFYINGEGSLEGDYSWVVARRDDVGGVGEFCGGLYTIISTATQPGSGENIVTIAAKAMLVDAEMKIVSWDVTRY